MCAFSHFVACSGQNIKEGKKNIDSLTSARDLIQIARDTIIHKIEAFCPDFPWRDSEFVVRDAGWVDLSTHPQSVAYFYTDCISFNHKTSKTVFKTKCFPLMVVIPASQWLEYEMFMEDREKNASQVPTHIGHSLTVQSTDFSRSHNDTALFLPNASPTTADHAPGPATTILSKKRGHQLTRSSDSIVTNGPQPAPRAKKVAPAVVISPPRDAIRQALEKGGTANVDVNLGLCLFQSVISLFLTRSSISYQSCYRNHCLPSHQFVPI